MNRATVLRTVGVIIIGAIGSGVWELIKPVLAWAWEGSVSLSTLGIDSLRDGIYADAAVGVIGSTGWGAGILLLCAQTSVIAAVILHAIVLSVPGPHQGTVRAYFWITVIGSMVLMVAASRLSYVAQLSNFYLKLETIAAPHLSDADHKKRRADLVQVKNRKRFLEQIRVLSDIIEGAGLEVPKREFI